MTIKYWVVDLTIYKEKCIPTEEIVEAVNKAVKSVGEDDYDPFNPPANKYDEGGEE